MFFKHFAITVQNTKNRSIRKAFQYKSTVKPVIICVMNSDKRLNIPFEVRRSKVQSVRHAVFPLVSLAAVLCLVTQRSSPQTAAHIRTTFLSHCFCGLMKGPIMYQQIENDVSVRAKKDNGTSGRSFSYDFLSLFFLVVAESSKFFVGSSPSGSNERVFIFWNSRLILLK